jgi:putative zinc finger/helix-turn-helix YgiT family protein
MTHNTKTKKPRKRCDRPFPWLCTNCLKEEVYPETITYAADVKYDRRLHHLEIPELKIPVCRTCGERVFSNTVDDQIVQALRAQVRLLTPQQIKAGRTALRLKKTVLAERLGVAPKLLSRWEAGAMIQSRAMDNFLRAFFAVPELRAVLWGANQDANLGTSVVPESTVAPLKKTAS